MLIHCFWHLLWYLNKPCFNYNSESSKRHYSYWLDLWKVPEVHIPGRSHVPPTSTILYFVKSLLTFTEKNPYQDHPDLLKLDSSLSFHSHIEFSPPWPIWKRDSSSLSELSTAYICYGNLSFECFSSLKFTVLLIAQLSFRICWSYNHSYFPIFILSFRIWFKSVKLQQYRTTERDQFHLAKHFHKLEDQCFNVLISFFFLRKQILGTAEAGEMFWIRNTVTEDKI